MIDPGDQLHAPFLPLHGAQERDKLLDTLKQDNFAGGWVNKSAWPANNKDWLCHHEGTSQFKPTSNSAASRSTIWSRPSAQAPAGEESCTGPRRLTPIPTPGGES
jgi:hypothetical protein